MLGIAGMLVYPQFAWFVIFSFEERVNILNNYFFPKWTIERMNRRNSRKKTRFSPSWALHGPTHHWSALSLTHLSSPRSRRASDRSFCSSGPPVVASSSPPRAAASAGVSALSRRPASRRPCCCCVGPHPALRSAGRCPVGSAGPPRRRGAVSPSTGHASCGRLTWTAEGLSGDFSGNSFSFSYAYS